MSNRLWNATCLLGGSLCAFGVIAGAVFHMPVSVVTTVVVAGIALLAIALCLSVAAYRSEAPPKDGAQ